MTVANPAHRPTDVHKTAWRPLRVYSRNQELEVTSAHTYGYRAECDCDWRGPVRSTVALVRIDIRGHRAETGGA